MILTLSEENKDFPLFFLCLGSVLEAMVVSLLSLVPQPLETYSGMIYRLGHDRFRPNAYQFITHLTCHSGIESCSLATDWLVK
jgi:hypothetical protein